MNKDDMSDDAEFDAFLKGEGELARRLQALAQPGPSAGLDAAILANARAAMAQEARPQAANDSGAIGAELQLARRLGWRWRVPAGIAASVLVGVFAKQAFDASGELNQVSMPPPVVAEMVAMPPTVAPPPPPPAEAIAADAARVAAPAAVAPAAPVEAEQKRARPARVVPAPAADAVEPFGALPAPAPAPAAAPPPAPVVEMAPPVAPAKTSPAPSVRNDAYSKPSGRVQPPGEFGRTSSPIDSRIYYEQPKVELPTTSPAPAAAPARAPQPKMSSGRQRVDLAREATAAGVETDKAPLTPVPAPDWLERIEKLLTQGRKSEALAEWKAFRAAYPEYPVPDTTKSQLE